MEKCILVCANCHAEIHFEQSELTREIKRQEIENEKRFRINHSSLA